MSRTSADGEFTSPGRSSTATRPSLRRAGPSSTFRWSTFSARHKARRRQRTGAGGSTPVPTYRGPMLEIRPADETDVAAISAMQRASLPETYGAFLGREAVEAFVAGGNVGAYVD